jgi:hypothetical protein
MEHDVLINQIITSHEDGSYRTEKRTLNLNGTPLTDRPLAMGWQNTARAICIIQHEWGQNSGKLSWTSSQTAKPTHNYPIDMRLWFQNALGIPKIESTRIRLGSESTCL